MIYNERTNANPMPVCGMAIKLDGITVSKEETKYINNCCFSCECEDCYPIWVGGEDWQNDKSTFAFLKGISTDTFAFTVWKNGTQVASITDNTYGDLVISYAINARQYSLVLDWDSIYNVFGLGEYQVKNTYTYLGSAKEYVSQKFCMSVYDCKESNGWIKLEWNQSGNIESNDFKFCTPLYHSVKVKGWIKIDAPQTIQDVYKTSKREVKMFRIEQKNNYVLNSKLIRENLLPLLNENMVLANKIILTDFNVNGTGFVQKQLKFVEFGELNDHIGTNKMDFTMPFEDYKQNIIKTDCC